MKSQMGGIMLLTTMSTKFHNELNKLTKYLLTAFYVSRLNTLYQLIHCFLPQVLQSRDNYYPHVTGEENKAKNI